MTPQLDIRIQPVWDEIDGVREQTSAYLRKHGVAPPGVDAVAMVACELTENAVKYGHFKGDRDQIQIRVVHETAGVTVEVSSPVRAEDEEDLARLDRMVQWIRGYQDPFEAYLDRLKEVSTQRLDNEESGLGLVRIAYEGQSVLDFYVDDRNVLSVSAVYQP